MLLDALALLYARRHVAEFVGVLPIRALWEKRLQCSALGLHELLVTAHRVIPYVGLQVSGYVKKVFEALKCPAEEVRPFSAFQFWLTRAREVDHLTDVGIIPATERDTRNEILLVYETEGFPSQQVIVVAAELVKADPRLTECVNAVHRTDSCQFHIEYAAPVKTANAAPRLWPVSQRVRCGSVARPFEVPLRRFVPEPTPPQRRSPYAKRPSPHDQSPRGYCRRRADLEDPLKTDWCCIEICHPVLGVLGASECYYGEFVATGAEWHETVSELFGQIDPTESENPSCFIRRLRFFARAVGCVCQPREQQCVFGVEAVA